jgi:hypothetical protein
MGSVGLGDNGNQRVPVVDKAQILAQFRLDIIVEIDAGCPKQQSNFIIIILIINIYRSSSHSP